MDAMLDPETWAVAAGLLALLAPVVLTAVLGLASLADRPLTERATERLVRWASGIGLLAALGVLGVMLAGGSRHVILVAGDWVGIPHYHFGVRFVFDRLSVPLVILSFVLCG